MATSALSPTIIRMIAVICTLVRVLLILVSLQQNIDKFQRMREVHLDWVGEIEEDLARHGTAYIYIISKVFVLGAQLGGRVKHFVNAHVLFG